MAQRFPGLSRGDFNRASAGTARRFDHDICSKHAGDAESIDCADGAKLSAAKPYAVLCLLPSERVSISNRAGRLIYSKEIVRLQHGNERAKICDREAGFFGDFVEIRRPAEDRKKLKNRSPDAVFFWLKSLIPFSGETGRERCRARRAAHAAGLVTTDQSGR